MKKIISLICLLIVLPVFLVAADEEPPDSETQKLHFIHIKNGEFMDRQEKVKYHKTTRGDVTTMFNKIKNGNKQKVVVHFHGGLVSVKNAFTKPMKKVDPAGFNKSMFEVYNKDAYPIFFVWRSGFIDTLINMPRNKGLEVYFTDEINKMILELNRKEKAENIIEEFLSSFRIDSKTLYTDLPENLLDDYNDVYNSWVPDKQDELVKALNDGLKNATEGLNQFLKDNPGIEEQVWGAEIEVAVQKRLFGEYGSWFKLKVLYPALIRLANGRHHGLKATIQEEIFNSVEIDGLDISKYLKDGWGTMKCITTAAFKKDGTPQEGTYGGTAFLIELNDLVNRRQLQEQDIRVILVGHSAGAVYICNLLEHTKDKKENGEDKYPALANFKFDVIFEAPACTFERFSKTIKEAGDKIKDFRMFALGDDFEKEDELVLVLYSNSLLYFVSSVAEPTRHDSSLPPECKPAIAPPYEYHDKPMLGMERYFLKPFDDGSIFPELKSVRNFLGYVSPAEKGKIAFSPTAGNAALGWRITAEKHGQCDDNVEVLKSLQYIIEHRF